jgi:uncharacterized GH25 family protein
MNYRKSFSIIVLILFATLVVVAHDTWLTPRRFKVKQHSQVLFDLTSGMAFPALETSIKPDRVDAAGCRLNSKFSKLLKPVSGPKSLIFPARFEDEGIATCWIELKPRQLELNEQQVAEYFAEIDPSQAVRDAWKNMKSPRRWRESYVKHAKTLVTVGDAGNDHSWGEPIGMSFEIVPSKNPAKLRAGDELPLRVLRKGNPVAQLRVNMVLAGQKDGEFQTTDEDGRTSFRIKRPGKYLVRATELRPSTKPDLEWESDFTTLTIEIPLR